MVKTRVASAVILVFGCSNGARKPELHASEPAVVRDAAAGDAASAAGVGDVQVRVEWRDVPREARSSPGRSACGTAVAPAVAPTTTWGVPDAFVTIDAPATAVAARIVYDRCAFVPRAVVARGTVAVTTTADHPVAMTIAQGSASRAIDVPIAGHEVDVPVADGMYELAAGSDSAWIAADKSLAAVTDASGQAVLRGVPAGRHHVIALVPARAGQPARTNHAEVDVVAGQLAEITVDVTR